MRKDNITEFDVEGLGHFKICKEAPVPTFFLDRRNEAAKLLGGLSTLIGLESEAEVRGASNDPIEKEKEKSLLWEINRAFFRVDWKQLLIESPKGFSLESLSAEEFNAVWLALERARRTFPAGTAAKADGAIEIPESKG